VRFAPATGYKAGTALLGGMSEAVPETEETTTWPELAITIYDRLTGRGAEITYEFDDMEIAVPNRTGPDAEHAHWRIDGTLRVSTRERE